MTHTTVPIETTPPGERGLLAHDVLALVVDPRRETGAGELHRCTSGA